MELLGWLSNQVMPVALKEPKDVFNLHVLRAAGYVHATIPFPHCALDGHWYREAATVRGLTPLGHTVLKFLGSNSWRHESVEKRVSSTNGDHSDSSSFKIPPPAEKMH
jgi:hypothetical protein